MFWVVTGQAAPTCRPHRWAAGSPSGLSANRFGHAPPRLGIPRAVRPAQRRTRHAPRHQSHGPAASNRGRTPPHARCREHPTANTPCDAPRWHQDTSHNSSWVQAWHLKEWLKSWIDWLRKSYAAWRSAASRPRCTLTGSNNSKPAKNSTEVDMMAMRWFPPVIQVIAP